jgi:hypothetical protein
MGWKTTIRLNSSADNVRIWKISPARDYFQSLLSLPLLFQRLKTNLDKAIMNLGTPPAMKIGGDRSMMAPSSVTEGRSRLGAINPR